MRNYLYKAFGVLFSVPFTIEGLIEADGLPEITVCFGDTPQKLDNVLKKGVLFQINHEGFLFELEGVARYWVKNNGDVFITKHPQSTNDDISVFLFSSVFAYLLQIKGKLTLHANVVYKNKNAFLIAGHSGSGKSTITYSLVNKGYSFFSDDIASITFDNIEKPYVASGLPRLKLWQDALQHYSISNSGLKPIRSQLKKYYYPIPVHHDFEKLLVKKLVILSTHNKEDIIVEKISGADKFTTLKSNTYRYQFLSEEKGIKPHFVSSMKFINQIDIYRVTRPNSGFNIDVLQKKIEEIFDNE